MALSPAAKVGATTLAAIIAVGAGLFWLTGVNFGQRGYDVDVVFQDVAGLLDGANVMLMGVKIGRVTAIMPGDRLVHVKVHVDVRGTHILYGSRFMIMSQGIVGEKSLEIFPPTTVQVSSAYVEPNQEIRGEDPQRLELVMEELTDTFNQFKESTDPKKIQEIFNKTAENLYETSETVKDLGKRGEGVLGDVSSSLHGVDRLVADTDRLIGNGSRLVGAAKPEDVRSVVSDLRVLTSGLRGTYEELFATPHARTRNQQTLETLRDTAAQLNKLAGALNNVTGDPNLQKDLKDIIRNLNQLTQTVNGAASLGNQPAATFGGFGFSPWVDALAAQTPEGTGLSGNLGIKTTLGNNYLNLGLEQIGHGNFLDLNFGSDRAWGLAGYHIGLIRSQIGLGADYAATPNVGLMVETYDPFQYSFRIGASYFPIGKSQFGLLGQYAHTIKTGENDIWLGLEWRPTYNAPVLPGVPAASASSAPPLSGAPHP